LRRRLSSRVEELHLSLYQLSRGLDWLREEAGRLIRLGLGSQNGAQRLEESPFHLA
jgi:hypothetical protein